MGNQDDTLYGPGGSPRAESDVTDLLPTFRTVRAIPAARIAACQEPSPSLQWQRLIAAQEKAIAALESALAERDREIEKWKWVAAQLEEHSDEHACGQYDECVGFTIEELVAKYDATHPAKAGG